MMMTIHSNILLKLISVFLGTVKTNQTMVEKVKGVYDEKDMTNSL